LSQRTSDVLVSYEYLLELLPFCMNTVENKDMIPQRDYSDFTKYVNENQAGAK
jgi:hypothetical protein